MPVKITPESSENTATTTQEIDTSDWLTYKNDEYGFEFKYPKEYILNEKENSISIKNNDILVQVDYYRNYQSERKMVDALQKQINYSSLYNCYFSNDVISSSFYDYVHYLWDCKKKFENKYLSEAIINNKRFDYFLEIKSLGSETEKSKSNDVIYNIVKTLKFSNLYIADDLKLDTNTWQKYENDLIGIRFLYPLDWTLISSDNRNAIKISSQKCKDKSCPNISIEISSTRDDSWLRWYVKNKTNPGFNINIIKEVGKVVVASDFNLYDAQIKNLAVVALNTIDDQFDIKWQINNFRGYNQEEDMLYFQQEFDKFQLFLNSIDDYYREFYESRIINWKTYIDSEYGFEFKYPPSWKISKFDEKTNSRISLVIVSPPIDETWGSNVYIFEIPKKYPDEICKEKDPDRSYYNVLARSLCINDKNILIYHSNVPGVKSIVNDMMKQIISTFKPIIKSN